jgi:hypothetical protein
LVWAAIPTIACDEGLARFSPGVLLALDLVEQTARAGGAVDSSAVRDHAMVNRLWNLERRLRALGISPAPFGASPARDRLELGAWVAYRAARSALSMPRDATRRPL